jgi:hypothetical protein
MISWTGSKILAPLPSKIKGFKKEWKCEKGREYNEKILLRKWLLLLVSLPEFGRTKMIFCTQEKETQARAG